MITKDCFHEMLPDGMQLFTDRETGATLLVDTPNHRAKATIGEHVSFFDVHTVDELGMLLDQLKASAKQLLNI